MAHIFKKTRNLTKGIVVFTHQELNFILSTPEVHECVERIKRSYFIGIHYGGFSFGARLPPFCDFYMGRPSVTNIKNQQPTVFDIPLASGNFTAKFFCEDKSVKKYWDIINVSRNGKVKNLNLFFREIKKIYSLGHKYNVLLVCASRNEETEQSHFVNIADVYYEMFSKEERDMFTLMRLGKDLEFKGLSKKQLSYFYQASKVSTLFSEMEGFPGVVPESLLAGVPVVIWSGQRGSARDYLNDTNSVLFESFDDAHVSLIEAVENYDNFHHDQIFLQSELREDLSLKKLKNYFKELYEKNGQTFDGELINTDDLVSRLPAHFIGLPWATNRQFNGHMDTVEKFKIFWEEVDK